MISPFVWLEKVTETWEADTVEFNNSSLYQLIDT